MKYPLHFHEAITLMDTESAVVESEVTKLLYKIHEAEVCAQSKTIGIWIPVSNADTVLLFESKFRVISARRTL